jgi:cytoskeleton protein RodZ
MSDTDPQSHSELASFGDELRREREIRGISLKEIADATKISKRFLEAIERNDHKTLPAPVFTRGFVREYARYLGLNAEEMVNRYNYAAAGDDRIEKSPHLERLTQPQPVVPPPPLKRGIPPAYARVDRNVWLLVVIVAVLVGAIWLAWKHKTSRVETEAAARPVAAPRMPKPSAAVPVAAPKPAQPADNNLHLTLDLLESSWITLETDGKTVVNDEMRKGDHRTFEAQENFRFKTIGNAAGVKLTLNGVELPPLGPDGKVVHDLVYDRSSLPPVSTDGPQDQQALRNPS